MVSNSEFIYSDRINSAKQKVFQMVQFSLRQNSRLPYSVLLLIHGARIFQNVLFTDVLTTFNNPPVVTCVEFFFTERISGNNLSVSFILWSGS